MVIGPSGCGKTTLPELARLIPYDRGKSLIDADRHWSGSEQAVVPEFCFDAGLT
jgi:ABC-type taurine transport system ATPase subunit